MQEITVNQNIFWLPQGNTEAVAFTTNGIIRKDGRAVVGKGIAKEANDLFHIDQKLAHFLRQYGNRAFNLGQYQNASSGAVFTLFSFPTKYDWKEDSDVTLICKSAEQLMQMCDKFQVTRCYIPPVGCGCGNLSWEHTVKPWISQILDDRFVVIFNNRR